MMMCLDGDSGDANWEDFAFKNFPSSLKEKFQLHSNDMKKLAISELVESIEKEDFNTLRDCLQQLHSHRMQKYSITMSERKQLIEALFPLLWSEKIGLATHLLMLNYLPHLLKRKEIPGLEIDWRKLFDFFIKITYVKCPDFPATYNVQTMLLPRLIRKARRFFPKDCTKDILKEIVPILNPHDTIYARAVSTAVLFLPNDEPELWIDMVCKELQERQLCASERHAWIGLLARATKHNIGKIDWASRMPTIFNICFKSLGIHVAGQTQPCRAAWSSSLKSTVKQTKSTGSFAKLLVYSIDSKSTAADHLMSLLRQVRIFLYPSNKGKHSNAIYGFLANLCQKFVQRVAREEAGELNVAPEDRLKTLIPENHPLVPMLFEAVNWSWASFNGLKQICSLWPRTCVPLALEEIRANAMQVQKPQKRLQAAVTLSSLFPVICDRVLFPEGAEYLQLCLDYALEIIDPNTPPLAASAITGLSHVFVRVPFLKPVAKEDDPVHDEARRQCYGLEDWSIRYVNKLISFLPDVNLDQGSLTQLILNLRAFCNCLSDEIFEKCFRKLLVILDNVDASQNLSPVLFIFVSTRPGLTAPTIIRRILDRMALDSNGQISGDKKYILHYVNALYRVLVLGREHVIPFHSKILTFMHALKKRDETELSSKASKLATSLFDGIGTYRISEFRPFPEMNENTDEWRHWRDWGCYHRKHMSGLRRFDVPDLQLSWFEPGEKEHSALQSLADNLLIPAVKSVSQIQAEDLADPAKLKETIFNLEMLCSACSSCIPFFGDFMGEALSPYDTANVTKSKSHVYQPAPMEFQLKMQDGKSFRETVAQLIVGVIEMLKKAPAGTYAPVYENTLRLAQSLLQPVSRQRQGPLDTMVASCYQLHDDTLYGFRMARRNVLAYKVSKIFMTRIKDYTSHFRYTQLVDDMLISVASCVYSSFKSVRKGAVTALVPEAVYKRFLPSIVKICLQAFQEFKKPRSDEERHLVLGALEILHPRSLSKVIGEDTQRQIDFYTSLIDGHIHTHSEIQDHMFRQYIIVLSSYVEGPRTEENFEMTSKLESFLIGVGKSGIIPNWRYQLMLMLMLFKQLRKGVAPSLETLQYIYPMISHDNPMICRGALFYIETTAAMYFPSKGEPQQNENNVQGWHPDCTTNRASFDFGSVKFDEATLKWIEQFVEENVLDLVKVVVGNHEKLNQPGSGSSRQRQLRNMMQMAQMGKGDVLLKLFRTSSANYLTQISSASKDFKRMQARFIRNICFTFFHNKKIINTLLSESMRLSENLKENDHQYGAAEIFAGVCRAHVLQVEPVSSEAQEQLLNHFVQCMMNVNSDCIPAWDQAFRYIMRKTAPERMTWLTGPILDNAFIEVEEESLDYSKRFLKCVLHIVLSQTWRGSAFIESFFEKMHSDDLKLFSTPFRDVRSLLMMIYSVCARFLAPRPGGVQEPLLQKLEQEYLPALLARARKMHSEYAEKSSDAEANEQFIKSYLYFCSSISLLVFQCTRYGHSTTMRKFLPQMLFMLIEAETKHTKKVQLTKDATAACCCLSWNTRNNDEEIQAVFDEVFKYDTSSWKQSRAMLYFLKPFVYNNATLLTSQQREFVYKKVLQTFKAKELEVRTEGQKLLSLMMCDGRMDLDDMIAKFTKKAKRKLKKSRGTTPEEREAFSNAVTKRLIGVLGLISLCRNDPFTVQDWMPTVLGFLARLSSNPNPIALHVKSFFQDFKKSHEDSWQRYKLMFDRDQLEDIRSVTGTYNYFA